MDTKLIQQLLKFQLNEITEHHIYSRLARVVKSPKNRKVLEKIAADELKHSRVWRKYTGEDVAPGGLKVWFYYTVSRIFGLTFGIKLMEQGEENAQRSYAKLKGKIKEINTFIADENAHEKALINLIDEESLQYAGSVVLGLNDALVELTGALAGLTLAFQNTRLIALSGLITGIAAALSMATSEYLSNASRGYRKEPAQISGVHRGGVHCDCHHSDPALFNSGELLSLSCACPHLRGADHCRVQLLRLGGKG